MSAHYADANWCYEQMRALLLVRPPGRKREAVFKSKAYLKLQKRAHALEVAGDKAAAK